MSEKLNSSKQIKLGAIISYFAIAINMIVGLLYTPWMIHGIGKENYGLYILATSLISIFTIDFGMSLATTRFVAKYNAEGDHQGVNNLLGIVYKLYMLIAALIFTALLIAYFFLGDIYTKLSLQQLASFKIVYIIVASYSVFSFPFVTLNGILAAHEKFVALKVCDLIQKLTTVVLVILALALGYGLYALVAINAVTGLLIIVVKWVIIRKSTPVKVNFKFKSRKVTKEIFGFSMWSTVIAVCQRLIFNIAPSILGMVAIPAVIAVFGTAVALEGYTYTFTSALSGLFLPRVTRIMVGNNESENLMPLMIKVGRIQLYILGLIFIGFLSVGQEFIYMWLGPEFRLAYYCTLLIIAPSLIDTTQQIADTAVSAANKVMHKSFAFIGMAVINIGFSFYFSSIWGAVGASVSICAAYLIRTVVMNIVYYKTLKINVFEFFKETHLKMLLPMVLSLITGYLIHIFIPIDKWLGVVVKGGLVAILYLFFMWILAFNKYEKNMFYGIYSKLKRTVLKK